jgi:ribosomal protein S18 acetylase RimI-like enzyme
MSISFLEKKDINSALNFFNENIDLYHLLYQPMDIDSFRSSFFSNNDLYQITTFIYVINNQILGLISASYVKNQNKAYISFLMVDINHQKKGIGKKLLKRLESVIIDKHQHISSLDIVFFNPIHMKWHLPQDIHIEHPNAPGVDIDSDAYTFFIKHDYHEYAVQNVYYKNLKTYNQSKEIQQKIKNLQKDNIQIMFYDLTKHHGFDMLFEALKSKSWEDEIVNATHKLNLPVLVAVKNDLIIGFAGPLYVEPSMRGYFAGIGIHPSYRSLGIGSVLFSNLCLHLKLLGAHYMTLFTGHHNPARKIYEHEGFIIKKTFSNLRKTIHKKG